MNPAIRNYRLFELSSPVNKLPPSNENDSEHLRNNTKFLAVVRRHHYRLQTKFAKVMFLHLSVSHSVHWGGVCILHPGGGSASGVVFLGGGGGGWQSPNQILRDTANERAIRILLECILVYAIFSNQKMCRSTKTRQFPQILLRELKIFQIKKSL